MKYSTAAVAILAFAVNGALAMGEEYAGSNVTYTTIWTTALTTVCPSPTQFVQGGKTYTVTEATTLTITDCPCTKVMPMPTYAPPPSPPSPPKDTPPKDLPTTLYTSCPSSSLSPEPTAPTYSNPSNPLTSVPITKPQPTFVPAPPPAAPKPTNAPAPAPVPIAAPKPQPPMGTGNIAPPAHTTSATSPVFSGNAVANGAGFGVAGLAGVVALAFAL